MENQGKAVREAHGLLSPQTQTKLTAIKETLGKLLTEYDKFLTEKLKILSKEQLFKEQLPIIGTIMSFYVEFMAQHLYIAIAGVVALVVEYMGKAQRIGLRISKASG